MAETNSEREKEQREELAAIQRLAEIEEAIHAQERLLAEFQKENKELKEKLSAFRRAGAAPVTPVTPVPPVTPVAPVVPVEPVAPASSSLAATPSASPAKEGAEKPVVAVEQPALPAAAASGGEVLLASSPAWGLSSFSSCGEGTKPTRRSIWPVCLAVAAIIGLGVAAYRNSFKGCFFLDDLPVAQFMHWFDYLAFVFVAGQRLLVQLSTAVNYHNSGTNPWGFHLFNLIVHLIATLAVFGVARRTLSSPRLKDRMGKGAVPVALGIALVFALHPLQTQAVTYVCQRAQSMMGMFSFLAFYCVIRSQTTTSPDVSKRPEGLKVALAVWTHVWPFLAVLAYLLTFRLIPSSLSMIFFGGGNNYISLFMIFFGGLYFVLRAFVAPKRWLWRVAWLLAVIAACYSTLKLKPLFFLLDLEPHPELPLMFLILAYAVFCDYRARLYPLDDGWRWKSFAWHMAAIFTALCGLDCKAHIVGLPLLLLIYERVFWRPSWREVLRRSFFLYLILAWVWCFNIYYLLYGSPAISDIGAPGTNPADRAIGMSKWAYGSSQFKVVLHYLQLFIWPHPLCFDSVWPAAHTVSEWLPYAIFVGIICLLALWAFIWKPAWGFLGAWFFVNLAPSSSLEPRPDICVEHRMYMPLPALAALAVCGAYCAFRALTARLAPDSLWRKGFVGWGALAIFVAALSFATWQRNQLYQDPELLWKDVLAQSPHNYRAHNNLGLHLRNVGKLPEAREHLEEALRLNPYYWNAIFNLGLVYEGLGLVEKAIAQYRQALNYNNDQDHRDGLAATLNNRGVEFLNKGDYDKAEADFTEAVKLSGYLQAHYNLGVIHRVKGKHQAAVLEFREVRRLSPGFADVIGPLGLENCEWGAELARQNKLPEAISCFKEAVQLLGPNYAPAVNLLNDANNKLAAIQKDFARQKDEAQKLLDYAKSHRGEMQARTKSAQNFQRLAKEMREKNMPAAEADEMLRQALFFETEEAQALAQKSKSQPGNANAAYDAAITYSNLGLACLNLGLYDDSVNSFKEALRLSDGCWQAHFNLGMILKRLGKYEEAAQQYREVMRLNPTYFQTKGELIPLLNDIIGQPLLNQPDFVKAEKVFGEVCTLDPSYWPAWYNRGVALYRLGKLPEAREAFKTTLRLNPNYSIAGDYLKQIEMDLKKP